MTAVDRQASLPVVGQARQRRSATGPCRSQSVASTRRNSKSSSLNAQDPDSSLSSHSHLGRPNSKLGSNPYLERLDSNYERQVKLGNNAQVPERPDLKLSNCTTNNPKLSLERPTAVLLLDEDGVLHPGQVRHERQQFQRQCMELLRDVISKTDAVIVLSTAWRLSIETRQIVAEKLKANGLPQFVSRTPNIQQFQRAREILSWVKKFRPLTWVAVDDWPLLMETNDMNGHFVQTRPRYGLQRDTADQIIELFRLQNENISREQT